MTLLLTYQPRPIPPLIRVVDFETTGTPEDGDDHAICEIGFCDVVEGKARGLNGVRHTLVNPGRDIPPEVRAVHHIRPEDVVDAPPMREAIEYLMEDDPPVFCAHNVAFEKAFFEPPADWICTYRVALRLWPDAPKHSNSVLRYWLDLDVVHDFASRAHRAGPDAYVTAALLQRCIEVGDQRGYTVADFIRWSSGPPLLHRVTFGKHKGQFWENLPTDYLRWIATAPNDLDADTKANARYRLRQRSN